MVEISLKLWYNGHHKGKGGIALSYARFYFRDPSAPKPNRPTRLGVNALVEWDSKLLMERRRDCDTWGLVGGGVKGRETESRAMARELWEETGLWLPPDAFRRLRVYGDGDRIASFRDGSVWRMVIVLYHVLLENQPYLRVSKESRELAFFSREELKRLEIVCTHRELVELFLDWCP